ncbi:MAG: peptidyl-tRNA hydrolase Pth2 [Nanobdellota archaeon]
MYKQAILVRQDLKLPKGKLAGQAAHASVEAALKSAKEKVRGWRSEGQKKVVLKVPDRQSLHKYNQMAKDLGLTSSLITDAGHTVIAPGTETAVAIGPDKESEIDKIINELKLL